MKLRFAAASAFVFTTIAVSACALGDGNLLSEVSTSPPATPLPGAEDASVVVPGNPGDAATVPDAPGIVCTGGKASCGGACVMLINDPKNCGACGNTCGTHPCASGVCQTYTVLASAQATPRGVAVDATSVYWTTEDDNSIWKMPLGGGAPVLLASGQSRPYSIIVDATSIYWSNLNDSTLMKLPIAGGTPVLLASPTGSGIGQDGTSIYWGNSQTGSSGKVMKVSKAGGAPVVVASVASPERVVVQGPWVYVYGSPGPVTISRVPTAGGTPVTIGTSAGSFGGGIAVDATSVYWADGQSVSKAPIGGGSAPVILETTFGVWHLATDGFSVFSGGSPTSITKTPVGGGGGSALANRPGNNVIDIVVDATSVYWTSINSGEVLKAPK